MDRLTYEIRDGGWCVDGNEVRTFEIEDNFLVHSGNAINKLKDYEDLEENGLLLKLPCRIGSIVYGIHTQRDNFDDSEYDTVVQNIFSIKMLDKIGKCIFLTENEAKEYLNSLN